MKRIAFALLCAIFSFGHSVGSQSRLVSAIPELVPPSNASGTSSGGLGLQPGPAPVALNVPVAVRRYRIFVDMPPLSVADHYAGQLAKAGWQVAFKQAEPTLALVRFMTGSASDRLVGTLIVVPFSDAKEMEVHVHLVRSRTVWRVASNGRTGGAGASGEKGLSESFNERYSPWLTFPREVSRIEHHGGGGNSESMFFSLRLQTMMSPSVLMPLLQAQLEARGWKVAARLGDAVQSVVRRTAVSGGERSEVWILTTMPAVSEIDAALILLGPPLRAR
jgi:hypothetical protein